MPEPASQPPPGELPSAWSSSLRSQMLEPSGFQQCSPPASCGPSRGLGPPKPNALRTWVWMLRSHSPQSGPYFSSVKCRIIVSNKHPSAQPSHDSDKGDDHTSHSCILSVLGQRDASSCPKHRSPRIHRMARWMGGAPAGGGLQSLVPAPSQRTLSCPLTNHP